MKLGVVSDTHGHVENTQSAIRMLAALEVDAVLHCGDIGSVEIVPLFQRWPTHFVFGNVDCDEDALSEVIEAAGQTCHGRFGVIELSGVKIALIHGDDSALLHQTIVGGQFNLVCHGHTHVPRNERIGPTLVLNPGALYRARRHTIAVVELPSMEVASFVV